MTDLTHIQSEQIAAWASEAAKEGTTIANLTADKAKEKDNG